jgi:hypothetical protein
MEKCRPKIWAWSVTFRKLPKVNNFPMGENSPNLITLFSNLDFCIFNTYSQLEAG